VEAFKTCHTSSKRGMSEPAREALVRSLVWFIQCIFIRSYDVHWHCLFHWPLCSGLIIIPVNVKSMSACGTALNQCLHELIIISLNFDLVSLVHILQLSSLYISLNEDIVCICYCSKSIYFLYSECISLMESCVASTWYLKIIETKRYLFKWCQSWSHVVVAWLEFIVLL
jgi:hypothetical protein